MAEREGSLPELYVQPGESHLVSRPTLIRTVLGSCIGAAFLVPRLGVGALCHPMLPACPPHRAGSLRAEASRRYVDFAIRDLVRQFDRLGARRDEVVVKLFGGADVLMAAQARSRPTVGEMNRETALKVLSEEGLEVAASCLGGGCGMHIEFNTESGEVLLRRLHTGLRRGDSAERQPLRWQASGE
ncbi:MAG TPA: chemotaxis protein CheD [Terracidiphilus sp.]|nr:chemotaxis protein CheD [Terracidiphilus sp.]